MSRVGPFDRNDIKVRDELQVQARNSALGMHADTIKPLGEPENGSQAWEAYVCGSRQPGSSTPPPAQNSTTQPMPQPPAQQGGGFQTYPAKGG